MFREYSKALVKRVDTRQLMQFKPPTLPPRIYAKQIRVNNAHYADFCKEVDWSHRDQVHPLYLQMLSLPLQMQCLVDKKSPFPLLGLIHAANTVEVKGRCDLARPFECRVRFSDVRPHSRGWEVDITLQAFQDDHCVYQATSSYLVKVKAVHVAPRAPVIETQTDNQSHTDVLLSELSVPANTGRRYAKISGDYNPIHLFTLSAKLFGFKQPIAHGMWTLARSLSLLPLDNGQHIETLKCRFKRPVFLPAVINVFHRKTTELQAVLNVSGLDENAKHLEANITFKDAPKGE